MRKAFYILNFAMLATFVAAIVVDEKREWKDYQRKFYRLQVEHLQGELSKAKDETERQSLQAQIAGYKRRGAEVKQIMATELNRVDRCITCHVGMDEFTNPSMATPFKEHPFASHPGDLHKSHDFKKFGCTSCHAGQGLATTAEDAHGFVHHWEQPMLKAPYIQASCVKCHADFESLKGAEAAVKGKQLIAKNGCVGCHSFNGVGGILSVDLGDIADKPFSRIDFAYTGLEHKQRNLQNWIELHFTKDTMELVPGDPEGHLGEPIPPSGMPPFYQEFSKEDAQAITAYLMGQTAEKVPHDFFVYAPPKPEPKFPDAVKRGHYVFEKYGCAGCHGVDAKKGRRNFNARGAGQTKMEEGVEPTLPETMGTFTREELKLKIQQGVTSAAIAKFKADGPTPPLYMPAWGEKIKGQELEDLVTYLQSIAKKGEEW